MALLAGTLCLLLPSCDAERDPCLQPVNVAVRLQFLQRAADTGNSFRDTALPNMLINPVDGPETYTIAGVKGATRYDIRLSPLSDVCRWYIQPDSSHPGRRDTLTFLYERRLHFISNACGYTYYYALGEVSTSGRVLGDTIHAIDSVVIADRDVNGEAGKVHVKVYFHKP
jgi:hypothetical protein